MLERVIEERGARGLIRCDNGLEFTSVYFVEWCKERSITVLHVQPGKPVQNGHVESFNGADARRKIAAWREEYNEERPHSSLAYRAPEGGVRQNLLKAHQRDGRHPAGPPVSIGGIAQQCSPARVRWRVS